MFTLVFTQESSQVKSSTFDRLPYGCLLFMYRLDLTHKASAGPSLAPTLASQIWAQGSSVEGGGDPPRYPIPSPVLRFCHSRSVMNTMMNTACSLYTLYRRQCNMKNIKETSLIDTDLTAFKCEQPNTFAARLCQWENG